MTTPRTLTFVWDFGAASHALEEARIFLFDHPDGEPFDTDRGDDLLQRLHEVAFLSGRVVALLAAETPGQVTPEMLRTTSLCGWADDLIAEFARHDDDE